MIDPNEPAYPHLADGCQRVNETEHFPGLTKREWFAAMAMQGLLSWGPDAYDCEYEKVARVAVHHADALIAELNRTAKEGESNESRA